MDAFLAYRQRGLAAFERLILEVPCPLPTAQELHQGGEGRSLSAALEDRWKASLPETITSGGVTYTITLPSAVRAPSDICLDADGQRFVANFKAVAKAAKINIVGDSGLQALFLNKPGRCSSQVKLAASIGSVLSGEMALDLSPRDYFCLYWNYGKRTHRVVPLTAVAPQGIYVNPKNGFQIDLEQVDVDLGRPLHDALTGLMVRYGDYLEAQAAPWVKLQAMLAAQAACGSSRRSPSPLSGRRQDEGGQARRSRRAA